jgi:hypothetical protein
MVGISHINLWVLDVEGAELEILEVPTQFVCDTVCVCVLLLAVRVVELGTMRAGYPRLAESPLTPLHSWKGSALLAGAFRGARRVVARPVCVQAVDWSSISFDVISIETYHMPPEVLARTEELLAGHGYLYDSSTAFNRWYVSVHFQRSSAQTAAH